jgi:hypothetical protein
MEGATTLPMQNFIKISSMILELDTIQNSLISNEVKVWAMILHSSRADGCTYTFR